MCFALYPEMSQGITPSGSLNLSRIDNVELEIEMQDGLENEQYSVYVFSRSWNVMKFKEGVAGAAYQ